MQGQWVDKLRIYARGGAGGQGSQRLGGCGGKGGDVVVSASTGASLTDLSRLPSQRFIAPNGENCSSSCTFGRNGENVTISVPPGTVVWNDRGKQVCMCVCAHVHVHVCMCMCKSYKYLLGERSG